MDDFVTGDDGQWSSVNVEAVIGIDNSVSFLGLEPGDYVFEYQSTSAVVPCDDVVDIFTVTLEDCVCPPVLLQSPPRLCNDNGVFNLDDLLMSGVGEGEWQQSDGPSNLLLQDSELNTFEIAAGIYTFEYTLAQAVPQGCDNSSSISIEVEQAVAFEIASTQTVCNQFSSLAPECINLETQVTGDDGFWEAPANYDGDFSDISQVCFTGYEEGERFLFRYTSNTAIAPCEDKFEDLEVIVMDCSCPILALQTAPPLCNDQSEFNLRTLETDTTVAGTWIFISGPDNLPLNDGMAELQDAAAGEYILRFEPEDTPPSSCDQFADIVINISEYLQAGSGRQMSFCEKQDSTLDLSEYLDNADAGGRWQETSIGQLAGSAFDNNSASLNIGNLSAGIYEFEYTVTPEPPCAASSAYIAIELYAEPVADAGEDVALTCESPATFIGGQTVGSDDYLVYSWFNADQPDLEIGNEAELWIENEGRYILQVTNRITSCSSLDEIIVRDEIEELVFEIQVSEVNCEEPGPGTIEIINAAGGDGDYRFSIDGGASWYSRMEFSNLSPGSYNIIMQDGNLCEYELSNIVVPESTGLNVSFGGDIEIEYSEELIPLELMTNAAPEDISSILWEQDGEVICTGDFFECNYLEVDVFNESEVCVTVTDINNCEDSDCILIKELLKVNVYIPNVFSPLSYSRDAVFFVQTNEVVEEVSTFNVFDRWGGTVFEGIESHAPNEADYGWDGTWQQEDVMPGVYTYHIVVKDIFGEEHSFAGEVTLLR